MTAQPAGTVPFREAVAAWWRIGLASFGGPAGQIGVIHRVVVTEKRWVDEARFLHALSYCTLLPGPEAQQLVTYLGWLLHGTRGALVAGTLFILPGVFVILGLSFLYVTWGSSATAGALLFGLKAAVVAVVFEAVVRLRARAARGPARLALAGAAFVAIFAAGVPFPAVVLLAGLAGYAAHRAGLLPLAPIDPAAPGPAAPPPVRRLAWALGLGIPLWLAPVLLAAALLGSGHILTREGILFGKTALVTFGGAYAVLAYVARQAVEVHGWVRPDEMLDGLGLAESTPGPLILVVQFVAFLAAHRAPGGLDPLLAGGLGALLTIWVIFVPSFLFILAGAPYVEALRGHRGLRAVLEGIMAAVVGVVTSLGLWFALHVLFGTMGTGRVGPLRIPLPEWSSLDPAALLIALAAFAALTRFRQPLLRVLGVAIFAGAALQALG